MRNMKTWRTVGEQLKYAMKFMISEDDNRLTATEALSCAEEAIDKLDWIRWHHIEDFGEADIYRLKRKAEAKPVILENSRKAFPQFLIDGLYIGYGYVDVLSEKREPIKPHLWEFLVIDYDKNSASGGGISYNGLRFLVRRELTPDEREEIDQEVSNTIIPPGKVPSSVKIVLPEEPIKFQMVKETVHPLATGKKETPLDRKHRLEKWLKEEMAVNPRGAKTRVAKREGITTQALAKIFKNYHGLDP
ncbi:MAG: hypothetical protein HQL75_01060 [Magnetococcales bacterium]|nr:hypothetical protein [Magnetococcales bacterium]